MSRDLGKRNRLVLIEKREDGVNAMNQPSDTWETAYERWGRPMTKTGMSVINSIQEGINANAVPYSWEISYTPGIDVGMRVNHKGTIYDIIDIRHDEQAREYTHLVCNFGGNRG